MERGAVDLIRIPREEVFYDREEVLGRDAASVFPKAAQQAAAGGGGGVGGMDADSVREALGARKFISEAELETVRGARGPSVEDGSVPVDRPLVDILRENKARKEAEFADKWKTMKTGKNRPLEPEELDFLDSVLQQEHAKDREWSMQQRQELDAFREAVAAREKEAAAEVETADAAATATGTAADRPGLRPHTAHKVEAKRPAMPLLVKPMIKVKPKAGMAAAPASAPSVIPLQASTTGRQEDTKEVLTDGGGKRQRVGGSRTESTAAAEAAEFPVGVGLRETEKSTGFGLLSGYSSDDSD